MAKAAKQGKQGKPTGGGKVDPFEALAKNEDAYRGKKPIQAARSPFWSPWDDESEHPNPIEGAFMGMRKVPAHGKFREQTVIDLETADDGPYTIAVKGNLSQLLRGADLKQGQEIAIEWRGLGDATEAMPNGMHVFALWAE